MNDSLLNGGGGNMVADDSMAITEHQHGSNIVLDRLRKQRAHGRFCDVQLTLKVSGRQFGAHRNVLSACSPYFDSIFRSDKVVKEHVTVNCKDERAFELLLDYMYSGCVVLDQSNVIQLLKLSNNFLVSKLKHYCAEYLERHMNSALCLTVEELAERYNLPTLAKSAQTFAADNINNCLLESIDAHTLPIYRVERIFAQHAPVIRAPIALNFILRWCEYAPTDRSEHFENLLCTCVRLADISTEQLCQMVQASLFLRNDQKLCLFVLQTITAEGIQLNEHLTQVHQSLLPGGTPMQLGELHAMNNASNTPAHISSPNQGSNKSTGSSRRKRQKGATLTVSQGDATPMQVMLVKQEVPDTMQEPPPNSINQSQPDKNIDPTNEQREQSREPSNEQRANSTPNMFDDIDESISNVLNAATTIEGAQTQVAADHHDHHQASQSPSYAAATPLRLTLKLPTAPKQPAVHMKTKRLIGARKRLVHRRNSANQAATQLLRRSRRAAPKSFAECSYEDEESMGEVTDSEGDMPVHDVRQCTDKDTVQGDTTEGTVTEQTYYKCPHCVYTCENEARMNMHIRRLHLALRLYCCALCDFECKWNRQYYQHMRLHFEGPPYSCKECSYTTDRIQLLLTHRYTHNKEEQAYKCGECGERTSCKQSLVTHQLIHSAHKPYTCPECAKTFTIKSTLDQHLATHSEQRPYQCEHCSFCTKYQSHLISHKRIHTGDVFRCTYTDCTYSSPKKSQLAAHLRTHLAVRSHTCKLCKRSFIEKSHLVRHERIHLADKPFKCENCEYASSRRDKLKEHILKHHGTQSTLRQKQRKYRRARHLATLVAKQGGGSSLVAGSSSNTFRPITPSEPGAGRMGAPSVNAMTLTQNTARYGVSSPQTAATSMAVGTATATQNTTNAGNRPSSAVLPSSAQTPILHPTQPSPALSLNFNLGFESPVVTGKKDVLLSTNVPPTPTLITPTPRSPGHGSEQGLPHANTPSADLQRPMSLPPLGGQQPTAAGSSMSTGNGQWPSQAQADFSFTAMF